MKVHSVFIGVVAAVILMLGTAAQAQYNNLDPGVVRERMITWALASEESHGTGTVLADKIDALTDEQIMMWMSLLDDPEAFLRSLEQATVQLKEPQIPQTSAPEEPAVSKSLDSLGIPDLFSPDYPPGSGAYKDVIIDSIAAFGIGGATNTDRCLNNDWGNFIGVWWPLNKAFDTLDGACVVAGCDPIGIACAVTCGILETAKIALKIAAVPLEACDVHQGAIDGAEIEATYENVIHVHDNLATHDTEIKSGLATHDTEIKGNLTIHDTEIKGNLTIHDTTIKGALATHDTDIKALLVTLQETVDANSGKLDTLLERQLEVVRLLHTPQGRRDSDIPACNGEACDWSEVP